MQLHLFPVTEGQCQGATPPLASRVLEQPKGLPLYSLTPRQGELLAHSPCTDPTGLSLPTASQHCQCQGCSSDRSASNLGSSLRLIILYPLGQGQGDSARGSPTGQRPVQPQRGPAPPSRARGSSAFPLPANTRQEDAKRQSPPQKRRCRVPPPEAEPKQTTQALPLPYPQEKGHLVTLGLYSTARVPAGLPATQLGILCQAELARGCQGAWLQAHLTPLPRFQPQMGIPTVCLGVPGGLTLPGLQAGTPTPAQAQRTLDWGGRQQRHTGHYLAMFFYFQF